MGSEPGGLVTLARVLRELPVPLRRLQRDFRWPARHHVTATQLGWPPEGGHGLIRPTQAKGIAPARKKSTGELLISRMNHRSIRDLHGGTDTANQVRLDLNRNIAFQKFSVFSSKIRTIYNVNRLLQQQIWGKSWNFIQSAYFDNFCQRTFFLMILK